MQSQIASWRDSPPMSLTTDHKEQPVAFGGQISFNNPFNPPTQDTRNDAVYSLSTGIFNVGTNSDRTRFSIGVGVPGKWIPADASVSLERATKAVANHVIGPATQCLANGIERGLKWLTGQ